MAVHTAGFAQWPAEQFFQRLELAEIDRLIDVRLRPGSQLAGFAKQRDLSYFVRRILGAEYVHEPLLAPNEQILDGYRKGSLTWTEYENAFLQLMQQREIESTVSRTMFGGSPLLLCSEHSPEHCHRRLVCEYLSRHWNEMLEVVHIE